MAISVKLAVIILLGLVALGAYIRLLEKSTLFIPVRKIVTTPSDAGLEYEDIYITTADRVKINGWLVKAGRSEGKQAPTLIFLHGNAGNIGDRVEKINMFHQLGINVFIIDYRGFGRSEGRPTEKGMYLDALASYDYLKSRQDIDLGKIVAYGASLGGSAAVDLAAKRPVSALILDSTFTSAADMAKVIFPLAPSFLLSIKLDSISKIKDLKVPKLFIHSPDDETVPFALGQKLYRASPDPRQFLTINGNHNEGHLTSQSTYISGIKSFLAEHGLI